MNISQPRPARGFFVSGGWMKIFATHFHPNGFFISAMAGEDFWFKLGKSSGWGRFSMIRPETQFTDDGALFELSEVLPADSLPPSSVVEGSNVLWCLPEALEVLKSIPSSALQEYLQEH